MKMSHGYGVTRGAWGDEMPRADTLYVLEVPVAILIETTTRPTRLLADRRLLVDMFDRLGAAYVS